ncbi:DUF4360 domain-containing protein [Polyangium sp. 15x6]|uniref:DUF4360 domain-containing protein n=1 Tax=Polyangium sp. 15x6 TaxID=3042687 RepID=UPI00249C04EB|nr:DUF4360 domain-containing protein [Polyangium sp. 15x6]MDI3282267.1 DUF4360 domain-containing protein [Polyangium sp. 15x6]
MSSTKTRAMFTVSLLGLALGTSAAEGRTVPPPTSGLAVESVQAMGTGCMDASAVHVEFSPAGDEIIVRYGPGQLSLAAGPGIPLSLMGSYCRLQLRLRVPQGYSYAITGITHEGYADLDPGVTARRTAWFWFSGMVAPYRTVALVGPFAGNYRLTSDVGANPRYSACGSSAPLFLLMNVGLSNLDNPNGMGTVDAGEAGPIIRYRLSWQQCG